MNRFKIFNFILLVALLVGTASLTSCKKDKDTEQENITTVIVELTSSSFNGTFTWEDLDGPGGNAPVITPMMLPANGVFDAKISILDRSKSPEEDITKEVKAEDDAHLLTFSVNGANLTVAYADTDSKGKPLGLSTRWSTGGPSSGTLIIRLYHEPTNKDNLNNPGGDIDIEVSFPVTIQ
ncbi:MAG: type 1 periplasmic binding fold superfamily protein [Saprospiraceae bacterium]